MKEQSGKRRALFGMRIIVIVLAAEVRDLIVLRPKASFVKPEALGMNCFRYRSLLIMIEPHATARADDRLSDVPR